MRDLVMLGMTAGVAALVYALFILAVETLARSLRRLPRGFVRLPSGRCYVIDAHGGWHRVWGTA